MLEVLTGRHAFKIGQQIVPWVVIPVVNVAALRNIAESAPPNSTMQRLTAARKISLARPHTVKAAVKVLCDLVQPDRISVFGVRDSANIHPLAVLNG